MQLQLIKSQNQQGTPRIGLALTPCEFDMLKRSLATLVEAELQTLRDFFSDHEADLTGIAEEDAVEIIQPAVALMMLVETMMIKPGDFKVESTEVNGWRDKIIEQKDHLASMFRQIKREYNLHEKCEVDEEAVNTAEELAMKALVAWLESEGQDVDEYFKNASEKDRTMLAEIKKKKSLE